MDLNILFFSVLTPGIVSASVSAFFGLFIYKKLALYQANIAIKKIKEEELAQRRLKIYPKLAELIYRIRNTARDIITDTNFGKEQIEKINKQKAILIEAIYRYRYILQGDNLFDITHQYKNEIVGFTKMVDELQFHQKQEEEKQLNELDKNIRSLYESIDSKHKNIINSLTSSEAVSISK